LFQQSVLICIAGNLETYRRVASKLKLGTSEDEYTENVSSVLIKSPQSTGDTDVTGQVKTGRIPVRLYLWTVNEEFDDFEDAPQIDNWDKVSYINRPVELYKEDGKYFSLNDAVKRILPEFFLESSFVIEGDTDINQSGEEGERSSDPGSSCNAAEIAEIKSVRIQGIEPILDIPFSWVVNNLMNPEYFLHMCVCLKVKVNAVQ
ncbi:autophagy protein 5-like, partial [Vigna umbellata]|uniref:autophagy protein 5-like n=1 Tax=Vigna umbellata TaxID=87088 RepID=UPI001F5F0834